MDIEVSLREWNTESRKSMHRQIDTSSSNAIIIKTGQVEYIIKGDPGGDGLLIRVDGQLMVFPNAANSIILETL